MLLTPPALQPAVLAEKGPPRQAREEEAASSQMSSSRSSRSWSRAPPTLHISGCELITDGGLAHLRGIHTLLISGCALVTDSGLAHLASI